MARLTTSSQLELSLKALADELAKNLVDAVLRGSLAELVALPQAVFERPRSASKASVAVASAEPRSVAPAAKNKPARAPRAAPEARDEVGALDGASRGRILEALVDLLRKRPEGARAEELRSELGLGRARFIQATRDGLSTEEIRKVGQLRSTVYFAV